MKKFSLLFLLVYAPFNVFSQNWDINTLKEINSWDGKFIRGYSKTISATTPYISIGLPMAMAIYAGVNKNEELLKDAVYIGSSVGAALVLTYGLKFSVDRDRPYDRYPGELDPQSYPVSSSFPSAHTAMAFSLATSLSIKYPKWYVIAPSAAWACSVGFARMNEGIHYPSDVLAGAVIGTGCAVVNVYVNRWVNKWLFPEKRKATHIVY